jgi:Zn2+/Cd2+-exporting ATPase
MTGMKEIFDCCSSGRSGSALAPAPDGGPAPGSDGAVKRAVFHVGGMCCPTEEQLIRNRLKSLTGVEQLAFNLMEQELAVSHRLDDEKEILAALHSLGMEPRIKGVEEATASAEARGSTLPLGLWLTIGVSGSAALAAEIVAWSTGHEDSPVVIALALLSMAVGGRETLRKGLVALRTFTLNINFLMTLATIGAVAIGQWPEAAMVTFLFGVAELIEAASLDRARNAIRGLMAMTPETASVRDEAGLWRDVPASAIRIGQTVRVRPGERVALDGVVTAGRSSVNQAPITGESVPVEKAPGDPVFAGTINERGSLEFEVTADRGHTTLDRIVSAVQQAQGERAPTQRFVDQFARLYTPAVVLLALLVAVAPPLLLGQPFVAWLYKALVLLVIACPCALVISTPVTVVSALAAAARQGLLVKGGVYLEAGRRLRVIALDKTGWSRSRRSPADRRQPGRPLGASRRLRHRRSVDGRRHDARREHRIRVSWCHRTLWGATPRDRVRVHHRPGRQGSDRRRELHRREPPPGGRGRRLLPAGGGGAGASRTGGQDDGDPGQRERGPGCPGGR